MNAYCTYVVRCMYGERHSTHVVSMLYVWCPYVIHKYSSVRLLYVWCQHVVRALNGLVRTTYVRCTHVVSTRTYDVQWCTYGVRAMCASRWGVLLMFFSLSMEIFTIQFERKKKINFKVLFRGSRLFILVFCTFIHRSGVFGSRWRPLDDPSIVVLECALTIKHLLLRVMTTDKIFSLVYYSFYILRPIRYIL